VTDARDIDPTDAGHTDPADAGVGDPTDAGHMDPADAGDGGPTDAVPAHADEQDSRGDDGAPVAGRDDLVSAEERTVDPAVAEARQDVASALAALADAEERPAAEQVSAFDEAYETLQATLARIDEH
jgi:hypothetical protein